MRDIHRKIDNTLNAYDRGYRDQPEQTAKVNILGLKVGINQSFSFKRKYMKMVADFCDAIESKHEAFNISPQERSYFGKKNDLYRFIATVKKMQQERQDAQEGENKSCNEKTLISEKQNG